MSHQIEDRLRSALRAEADSVRLSPDPWQQNQRRVAAAASGRSRRVLTVAAVVLAVATLTGGVALLGSGGSGDTPASGTGDPFATEFLLGAPVEAETLTIDGRKTVHTIALSDMTGQGPNLCDQYEQVVSDGSGAGSSGISSGSGGCTTRDPAADDDNVAFDWLTGTQGSGDIRGVTAGVDSRVSKVQIWMHNGDMVLATLHPTGWDDTRMFALTLATQPPDAPTAQRLVAYSRTGNVLQAVDLPTRFGTTWLAERAACAGDGVAESVPNGDVLPNAHVELGTADAQLSVRLAIDDGVDACLERLRSTGLAGWYRSGSLVVLVTAPEVEDILLFDGRREAAVADVKPRALSGTPWRVATTVMDGLTEQASVVAFDSSGQELDREFLSQPSTP